IAVEAYAIAVELLPQESRAHADRDLRMPFPDGGDQRGNLRAVEPLDVIPRRQRYQSWQCIHGRPLHDGWGNMTSKRTFPRSVRFLGSGRTSSSSGTSTLQ